jgi:hypothetical protein
MWGIILACKYHLAIGISGFRPDFKGFFRTGCQTASSNLPENIAYNTLPYNFPRLLPLPQMLQQRGHIVGMTGDGVNDAPPLKRVDVGIAVSGATDAARAAADLVLTEPGLSVIIRAVEEARRIFERMNSYAIYRISETIRIMIFIVLVIVVYNVYPITAIMIILLALLNDLPIMTIAYDNTWLDPKPVRWQMHRVLRLATVLGTFGVTETFLLLVIAKSYFRDWIGAASVLNLFEAGSRGSSHSIYCAAVNRPQREWVSDTAKAVKHVIWQL